MKDKTSKIKILKMSLSLSFPRKRESSSIDWMPDQSLPRTRYGVGHDKMNYLLIKLNKKTLGLMAGDGKTLMIDELQPEGKRPMTAEEFINGYLR